MHPDNPAAEVAIGNRHRDFECCKGVAEEGADLAAGEVAAVARPR